MKPKLASLMLTLFIAWTTLACTFSVEGLPIPFLPTPTPTQIPIQVVIANIVEVAELVSVVTQESFTHQYNQHNDPCALIPTADTEILYSGQGEVRAGVDLNLISASDIRISGGTVTINLPPPQIVASSVRHEILDIDEPFSICNVSPTPSTLNAIESGANEAVLLAACEANILERANASVEDTLYSLMSELGFSEIIINTQDSQPCP
jgi:hypothetical protein